MGCTKLLFHHICQIRHLRNITYSDLYKMFQTAKPLLPMRLSKNDLDQFFSQKCSARGIMLLPEKWQKVLDQSGEYINSIKYVYIIIKSSIIFTKSKSQITCRTTRYFQKFVYLKSTAIFCYFTLCNFNLDFSNKRIGRYIFCILI